MKGKIKLLLLCTAMALSIGFGNVGMAKTEDIVQKTVINDVERDEIEKATVSDAALKNADINAGGDFEIDGTTLVGYRGNEKRVIIPDGIEVIGERAFASTPIIKEIVIPDSVKTIEDFAFSYVGLECIRIGKELSFIGERALEGCPLHEIQITPQNKNFFVENEALINRAERELVKYCSGSQTKNYIIPDGVVKLASCSFMSSSNLETIVIPDSVESTGKLVFSGCSRLKRVEIGSGIRSIYSCIFSNCRELEEFIVSPENKTFYSEDGVLIGTYFSYYPSAKKGKYYKIPDEVYGRFYFDDNPYIESIYISDHIKEIELNRTSSLRTLQVSENNKNFRVVDDVLFDYDIETLLCYPSAKVGQDYVVPATVKRFGTCSEWNAKELKNIYFSGNCPRKYPGEMDAAHWYDWIHNFSGEKIYDIYYYNDASWEELREGYNNNFGYDEPLFKMRFHKFKQGSSIVLEYDSIISDFDYAWLGESVKLKVVEPDLEHGIIKEKVPGFWRTDSSGNKIGSDGTFTGLTEGKEKIIAGGNELSSDIEKEILVKQKRVQSIRISPVEFQWSRIETGYKEKITIVEILPRDAYDKSVKWYSTDPDIIKVDNLGEITVMAEGEAEIYCVSQDGGKVESNHCKVHVDLVRIPKPPVEPEKKLVEEITIEPESVTIKKGDTASLSQRVYPEDAENKAVTWYSTEESVAMVDSAGVVTAVEEGRVEIYCIAQDEGKVRSNRCVVTVKADNSEQPEDPKLPVEPEKKLVGKITIEPETVTIKKGETVSLSQNVYPEDAENKTVVWYSTEEDVAKVDGVGEVTAVGEGTAEIYCIAQDEGKVRSNRCKVTVTGEADNPEQPEDPKPPIQPEKKLVERITIEPETVTIKKGETASLSQNVYPEDAENKTVVWYSTEESVAKVDGAGVVTAVGEGTAEIYCVAQDEGKVGSNQCKVTVTREADNPEQPEDPKPPVQPEKKLVERITIEPETVTIKKGETASLSQNTYPEDAENKAVVWYSTEESIAKVDSAGVVTAVEEGTAEIYCVAQDEGKVSSNRCQVTVKADNPEEPEDPKQPEAKLVQTITVSPSSLSLSLGRTQTLSVSVLPEDAENKAVTWHSTDPSVASVDETGRVRALKQGTTGIYCVSQDGSNIESNHCTVKVISGGSSGGGSGSGGGSSSGGGGSSSSGGGKAPSGGANTSGSDTLPSYVVKGSWAQGADGTWSFTDSQGTRYANAWAAVENPYANPAAGQQAFDWFRFDENGKMVVGWYQDPADGRWYYLSPISDGTLGRMITGWYVIDGSYYYFNPNSDGYRGRMYANETTPDGYYVDGSGRWVH